jgi:hypothetical protein
MSAEGRKKPMGRWLGGEAVRLALRALVRVLPAPVVYSRKTDDPYLSRWILIGEGKGARGLFPRSPVKICLHRIHRSDAEKELHSHPWRLALSLILAGSYREERRQPAAISIDEGATWHQLVEDRTLGPGSINVIHGDDFHRLEVIEDDAWSLFVAIDDHKPWSFWNRETGEVIDSRAFFARGACERPDVCGGAWLCGACRQAERTQAVPA